MDPKIIKLLEYIGFTRTTHLLGTIYNYSDNNLRSAFRFNTSQNHFIYYIEKYILKEYYSMVIPVTIVNYRSFNIEITEINTQIDTCIEDLKKNFHYILRKKKITYILQL